MDQESPRRFVQKKAVALRYLGGRQRPPQVSAQGRGHLALAILELARQHGVPVRQDPDLVEALARLDLDQALPPELCLLAAEVLAFVQEANQAWLAERSEPEQG